jgi:DNA-binding NtrC family response regulator
MAGTATLAPDRLLVEMESGDRATQRVFELARRVAASQSNLLILGESGTGKSLLARHVHAAGPRALGPFVEITCANLPDELIESELFGHERGAFTGAVAARIGKFEQARGGTVLIDGVTELSSTMQAKLLRVLQERTFERLGGNQTVEVEARILASCEPRIEDMVAAGVLRQDLFYRLNVVRLELPALRDRAGDAARLARRFLAELRPAGGPDRFSTEALEFFATYPWPGNLRELRNTVEGAALTCRGSEIAGPGPS